MEQTRAVFVQLRATRNLAVDLSGYVEKSELVDAAVRRLDSDGWLCGTNPAACGNCLGHQGRGLSN